MYCYASLALSNWANGTNLTKGDWFKGNLEQLWSQSGSNRVSIKNWNWILKKGTMRPTCNNWVSGRVSLASRSSLLSSPNDLFNLCCSDFEKIQLTFLFQWVLIIIYIAGNSSFHTKLLFSVYFVKWGSSASILNVQPIKSNTPIWIRIFTNCPIWPLVCAIWTAWHQVKRSQCKIH